MAFFFCESAILLEIKSHVKLEMGYAFPPGALVIETRKSSGIDFETSVAAAVTLDSSALTKFPDAFFTRP